jgi:predicted amino acid dehydrogenase
VDSFAFIIHPIDPKRDVSRKYPLLGRALTERQIDFFSTFFPPVYISEIEGIQSQSSGKPIKGWFIACPLTPRRMLELPVERVYKKIIQTGKLAERLGANILGLGAFTSVVGDGGKTVSEALDIPVTTGDSYTVSIAVQATRHAALALGINLQRARAAVVGATGSIGRVCADRLARHTNQLMLFGRDLSRLETLRGELAAKHPHCRIGCHSDLNALQQASAVLTVTSAAGQIIQPEHLRPGSVVCDVARPRDVSSRVAYERPDVLVIDGGMVQIPGQVDFNFNFGFPPGKAYACMAETIALTLEGRFENFTIGKSISDSQVDAIDSMARKHGLGLGGLRSFEKAVTQQQIQAVLQRAVS